MQVANMPITNLAFGPMGSVGAAGQASWTPVIYNNSVIQDPLISGTFTSTAAANGSWGNSQVSSAQGYAQGVYVSFTSPSPSGVSFMVGLTTTPTNPNFSGLNYALYSGGNLYIYEGNSQISNNGPVQSTDKLSITYDGSNVRYYRNGIVLRTVAYVLPAGSLFYMGAPFLTPNTVVTNLVFGPMGISAVPFGTITPLSTGTSLTLSTSAVYYNITTSGLTGIVLPAVPASGSYWVLRNNTGTYLSLALTGTTTGLSTPLSIPPSTSATIVSSGSAYVLF
jgi:hypothetical protein